MMSDFEYDCWQRKRIKKFHGKDMFFSSYGTFMHKLIELYHKGEKTPRQIVDMYLQDFKTEVVGRAPNRKVFSSYFTGGLQYLKALQPFPYGMVGVEKKVDFVVNGIPFVGYIDFLGEKDGDLYVVDNKSRILKPRSSRAKPTKADEELDAYLRQLYIYSAAVEEEYGKTPKNLCFNCFRDNLIYRQQESGKMELHITTPKTRAGTRIIPMFSDVRAALLQIRLKHMEEGFNECEVDGYTNFIFKNRFGEMLNPHVINRALERIIRDCNAEETERAEQEHREPVLLPHFSAHNLRHTFCTRLCENETNLKVIQEIMGHRNIETTMDVYNEATKEKKMSSFANLEGKIRVS